VAVEDGEFAFLSGDVTQTSNWHFDSGATTHMSPFESDFVSRARTKKTITAAFGGHQPANFVGKARINILTADGNRDITLKDTLHAGVKARLISVPALDRAGLTCVFQNGKVCVLKNDGKPVMTGSLIDRQYRLDTSLDVEAVSALHFQ
jgi:hypothetical protein